MKRAIPLILAALSASGSVAAEDLPRVAVFDLKSLGDLKSETVQFFLEQLLTEIDATGEYRSFGRSDLETMLGHEKMKETLGCSEESCMAEIAGSLGSRYLVAGSMARATGGYLINLKFIDSKQGGALRRINREVPAGLGELKRAARSMVRELLGLESSITGLKGELALRVRPGHARYDIDGGQLTGTLAVDAPFTLIELAPGAHQIKLSAENHEDLVEEVLVEADRVITLDRTLLAARPEQAKVDGLGLLDVVSKPEDGADIYLDGALMPRKTPTTLKQIPAGVHVLVLRKPLYKEWRQQVTVRKDALKRVQADLAPNFGRLEIHSDPPGADVYLDGIKVGATPFQRQRLEAKAYKLKLSASLYHDRLETVFVEPEKGFTHRYELAPVYGTLEIDTGEVKGARVQVDGDPRGETPLKLEKLASRRYFVKVRKDLHASWEGYLSVSDGQTTRKVLTLERRFGYLKIESDPPGAEVRLGTRTVGKTPLREAVSTGAQDLVVDAGPRFRPHRKSIAIEKDREVVLNITLKPRYGRLIVMTSVRDATVSVDGEARGTAPLDLAEVFVGEHKVLVSAPHHDPVERTAVIHEGQTTRLELDLVRLLPEEEARRLIAAWEDERRPYVVGGIVTGLAGLVAAGVGGYFLYSGTDKASQADSLYARAEALTMTDTTEADRLRQRTLSMDDKAASHKGWGAGLLSAGAAAIVAAAVVYLVAPDRPELRIEKPTTALVPVLGPDRAGLTAVLAW